MNLNEIFLVGLAAGIAGCAEKEQAASGEAGEMPPAVSVLEPEATPARTEDWRTSSFLDHMHAHAEHLDDLNYALVEETKDLEAARAAAELIGKECQSCHTAAGVGSE